MKGDLSANLAGCRKHVRACPISMVLWDCAGFSVFLSYYEAMPRRLERGRQLVSSMHPARQGLTSTCSWNAGSSTYAPPGPLTCMVAAGRSRGEPRKGFSVIMKGSACDNDLFDVAGKSSWITGGLRDRICPAQRVNPLSPSAGAGELCGTVGPAILLAFEASNFITGQVVPFGRGTTARFIRDDRGC